MNEVTAEVVKEHGPLQPIMQNTVAVGAILCLPISVSKSADEVAG